MHHRLLLEVKNICMYSVVIASIAITTGILIVVQASTLASIINAVAFNQQSLTNMLPLMLVLLSVMAGRAFLIWLNSLFADRAALTVKASLRARLLTHVQQLGPAFTVNGAPVNWRLPSMKGSKPLTLFSANSCPRSAPPCSFPASSASSCSLQTPFQA